MPNIAELIFKNPSVLEKKDGTYIIEEDGIIVKMRAYDDPVTFDEYGDVFIPMVEVLVSDRKTGTEFRKCFDLREPFENTLEQIKNTIQLLRG